MSNSSSNARIRRAAARRLRASPYPAIKRLECDFDRGRLTLHGQVRTFYEKQIAQEAIADLEGIDQVVNGVKVASP